MLKSLIILGVVTAFAGVTPAFACTDIHSRTIKLSACVDDKWVASPESASGAVEFVYLTQDQNFALQIITEDGQVAVDKLKGAILANAVAAAGSTEAVKFVSERDESIDGKPFKALEFTVETGGNTLHYQDLYYSSADTGTVQFMTFSLPEQKTTAAYWLGQYAATVKLGS